MLISVSKKLGKAYVRNKIKRRVKDILMKNRMAFRPAVEISYLKEEEQKELLDIMECFVCTPSLSQAQDFKRLSKDNKLTREYMETILEQEKPNQIQTLKVNMDKLNNILPTNLTTNEERENYVVKAVSFYGRWLQKKREQEKNER